MFDSLYITRSKIRRDLLALLFTNPSQRYYLRETERILGYSAGSIRRELLRFSKDDLLRTDRVGNLLYYSLNTRHPLFRELKAIVSKTVGVEGSLRKVLFTISNIHAAFVYGSFARNREQVTSDIDLMIVGDPDMSALHKAIRRLEKMLGREINPSVYSLDEFKARKLAKRGFIQDVLRNRKIMLIGREDEL
jgi:predicted nucleotidyltransferase